MSDNKENRKHLFYLHELSDFKVDSDDPDVRGWKVQDVDNRVIGKVDNLLVSKEKKKVVYLDVEVDKSIIEANHDPYGNPASGDVHEFINKKGENHLILPIGLARLNVDEKFVYTDKIDHQTFAETKRMAKGYAVDRDYEVVVLESYNRDGNKDVKKRDNDFEVDTQTGNYRSKDTGSGSTGTVGKTGLSSDSSKVGNDSTGMGGSQGQTPNNVGKDSNKTDKNDDRTIAIGDRDRDQTNRNRTGTTGSLGDRDTDLTDRDSNLKDRDKNMSDRDRTLSDRDKNLTDRDKRSGSDDDAFYDRGEFDQNKYRSNR